MRTNQRVLGYESPERDKHAVAFAAQLFGAREAVVVIVLRDGAGSPSV